MTRRGKGPLVPVLNAHNIEVARLQGVPTGKDRTLADARARKTDPNADKPKKVSGGIKGGDATKSLIKTLAAQGIIDDHTEDGANYGDQYHNSTLVNANSPVFLVQAEGTADTASTTNTVATVSAITMAIVLDVGKWAVSAMGSVILEHSTGATVAVSVEIDTDEGTARTVTLATAPGVRCFAHLNRVDEINWIQGEQTINVRVRYRSNTSGTTSAKNPEILALARRME